MRLNRELPDAVVMALALAAFLAQTLDRWTEPKQPTPPAWDLRTMWH